MIIQCPECGHQVSSKAPVCPNCGVEIAGKIKQCQQCGKIYLADEQQCPFCQGREEKEERRKAGAESREERGEKKDDRGKKPEKKKGGFSCTVLTIAFLIALIGFGTLWYFYNDAQSGKEQDDYVYAVQSSDPEILKSYLLRYPDAPEAHRDTIEAHLMKIQRVSEDWNNAVLSNSRSALKRYLDENPESPHRQEALNKIDSLDWLAAQKSNDEQKVKEYVEQHPDGRYIDEASILLSEIMRTKVQPDEKTMITSLFRQFFLSINTRDEERLTATVGLVINNFLGKENATSNDVLSFLHKIYKDDVTNMVWSINNETYKIEKTEVAEGEYEYDVVFHAKQSIEYSDNSVSTFNYRVISKVSNDGKISEFNLMKSNKNTEE